MRAAFNTIMAAVVIAALFCGNCFSCPQMLLAQQKHGCCPHSKTSTSDCQTQVLKSFVKAEKAAVAAVVVVIADIAPVMVRTASADRHTSSVFEYSPSLRTSLRI